jgi:phage tail-like protein
LNGEGTRRNGLIVLANELRVPIKIWSFENAIPVKWSGPSFNASTSAIAIESIEIAHEKLTLNMSPGKALDGLKNTVF